MKRKKFVSSTSKQSVIKGMTITPEGNKEVFYTLKGTVKDTDKAVAKIRKQGDKNFVSFTEPKIQTVKHVIPVEVFDTIAIDESTTENMELITFINSAIDKLGKMKQEISQ